LIDLLAKSSNSTSYDFEIDSPKITGLAEYSRLKHIDTGANIFVENRIPMDTDAKTKGDIFIDTLTPDIYIHIGGRVWKKMNREATSS